MKGDIRLKSVPKNRLVARLDGIGFTASILCAIHCAIMPFIGTFLPLVGLEFLSGAWLELTITVISIAVGAGSLVPSYRKYHHNKKPLIILTIGFVFILAAHFSGLHHLEFILVPLGAVSLAVSHYVNWKLSSPHHGHSSQQR